ERREIEDAIGTSTSKKRPSYVPWKQLLTSAPVWAIILVHGASVFGFFTVVNQLPTYMKNVLHFNIKEPTIKLDRNPEREESVLANPKIVPEKLGAMSKPLPKYPAVTAPLRVSWIVKIVTAKTRLCPMKICAIIIKPGGKTAAKTEILKIYSKPQRIQKCLPKVVKAFLAVVVQTYGQWQIVFGILAGVYIFGSLVYLIFGTGELQEWNNPPERKKKGEEDAEEGVPLKNNKIIS
uniref:Uncharacterized protein n=1 Tax=Phlebotomus papatasi TaxID=29031 RepID=A0A1B0D7V5_PHLPP